MACPRCGEHCTCSWAAAAQRTRREGETAISSLSELDPFDISEECFAASLDAPADDSRSTAAENKSAECLSASQARASILIAPPEADPAPGGQDPDRWRKEVTARLEHFRAKRRRPRREHSLSLDFERAVNRMGTDVHPRPSVCDVSTTATAQEPQIRVTYAEPRAEPPVESNIIEFPRLGLLPTPAPEELAEPILDRPRILDVPEAVGTASAPLADISIESEAAQVQFELPLQVAPMSRRALAAALDIAIVVLAAVLFLGVIIWGQVPMPRGQAVLTLVVAPFVFWMVYEYLFLVYGGGTTPGMQVTKLSLVTFDGEKVRQRARRGRAIAMAMSSLSLGLGVVWALLDEDTLCWHDRITRTYITPKQ